MSGSDTIQPARPERISAKVAVSPPKNVMLTPAARTFRNRSQLTIVTAKRPNGTAEPNKKKLPMRVAEGFCMKNARTASAGAEGRYSAPCRSDRGYCEIGRKQEHVHNRQ